jgi:hypothetical protein
MPCQSNRRPFDLAMRPSSSDPFERLAATFGLTLAVESLYSAPRDVASPPLEMDQHFLVTLTAPGNQAAIRGVFTTPLSDPAPPTLRDVLWWLAADGWAVERAGGVFREWAALHGYPAQELASARLFAQHVTQASSLVALIGVECYSRLLAAYADEISVADRQPPSRGLIRT